MIDREFETAKTSVESKGKRRPKFLYRSEKRNKLARVFCGTCELNVRTFGSIPRKTDFGINHFITIVLGALGRNGQKISSDLNEYERWRTTGRGQSFRPLT